MALAVELVRNRLRRATAALEAAGVPYVVVGGNAVAAWVAQVDVAAVRNTQDVDVMIRREDLPRAKQALEPAGFVYRHVKGIDMFLDGPGAKARDAVHILFANERVRPDDIAPTPGLVAHRAENEFEVLDLEQLVRMKLTAFRDKDRTHLRDMIEVGLIDASWPARFEPELRARLEQLLATPEG
jgi:hypothetical protein